MSWAEVCGRRLERHLLCSPVPDRSPAAVASAICGAHAQVLSAAELSIGVRASAITRSGVRDALWRDRNLTKTLGPRGTVHLLATSDLPVWIGALQAIPPPRSSLPAEIRLTVQQTDTVMEAIEDALVDAELTLDELTDAIVARAGSWAGDLVIPAFQGLWPRWRQAIFAAAAKGVLCFGPNRGRKVTYTNPHRWLPGLKPADEGDAVGELLRRYLHAYGPASPQHFARWLAAPASWAEQLFRSRADELQPVDIQGTQAWILGDDTAPAPPPEGVRLLPYFDAYTVGCHPRELLFPGAAATRALNRGQAGNYPVLLINGTVAGVWHQRRQGAKTGITVEPLTRLTSAQRRQLEEHAQRIGTILEADATLAVGSVSAGAHA
ncbi:MAG: winged helix DNA-binding domain-containing protein [Actinomycetota bacterium]|nr:winged helix DNA-binding domain-containing protein [Actinomycetota bacterium]